jgi:HSP20 family molecular chaperone IbpA
MNSTAVKPTGNTAQNDLQRTLPPTRRMTYTPQVDILELPDRLVIQIDLPGVKADAVEIDFERGELTVKARREPLKRSGTCLVEEFEAGDYYRAFLLSQDIAADQISAELKNGVLTIHLPRSAAALPRRVAVKG